MADEDESRRMEYEPHDRHGERLARLENDTAWIRKGIGEIKHSLATGLERMEKQDARLDAIEQEQAKVKTHFKWLYAIWATVQGAVAAWFTSK